MVNWFKVNEVVVNWFLVSKVVLNWSMVGKIVVKCSMMGQVAKSKVSHSVSMPMSMISKSMVTKAMAASKVNGMMPGMVVHRIMVHRLVFHWFWVHCMVVMVFFVDMDKGLQSREVDVCGVWSHYIHWLSLRVESQGLGLRSPVDRRGGRQGLLHWGRAVGGRRGQGLLIGRRRRCSIRGWRKGLLVGWDWRSSIRGWRKGLLVGRGWRKLLVHWFFISWGSSI